MLADRLSRPVQLRLKGRDWPILFTHDVLLEIESASGCDVMAGEFNVYRPKAAWVAVALWAVLKRAGTDYDQAGAAALIRPANKDRIHLALVEGWRASMAEPDKGAKEDAPVAKTRTWIEAWAIGRGRLGLTDQGWLDITPRMLQELSRVELERTRQGEAMMSRLTSAVINWSANPPKTAVEPDAFMLHPYTKQPEEPPMITGEYLSAMFGGNIFKTQ
jgi:hypothetical protein